MDASQIFTIKGGIEKETNELETQTEERLYLYSKGNKYTDITGGYTFKVIKNNDASYQDNSQYMYIYGCSRSGVGYGELELYSNKTVNVDTYKKMYIDMDYQVVYGEANWRCHFYYGLQGGKIIDVPGTNSSSGKLIEMDISNLKVNLSHILKYMHIQEVKLFGLELGLFI